MRNKPIFARPQMFMRIPGKSPLVKKVFDQLDSAAAGPGAARTAVAPGPILRRGRRRAPCDGGIEPHARGLIEVGLCMRLETHLTQKLGWFEHFNHPDTALSHLPRYSAPCVLC